MVCILQQVMIQCTIVSIIYGLEEWLCWVQNNNHMIQHSVCYFFDIHAPTSENLITFSCHEECITCFFPRGYTICFDQTGQKLVWWIWYLSVCIYAASSTPEILKMECTLMKIRTVKQMNQVSLWIIHISGTHDIQKVFGYSIWLQLWPPTVIDHQCI